jgi:RNA polymerase sigma-70 factor, ECF subfamily
MTLADLYEEYEEKLHGYALKLTRDPNTADDLVQETFIRVLGHLPLLEQLERYQRRSWLHQTLKNLFLDRQRSRQREAALIERFAQEIETYIEPDESPLEPDLLALVPEPHRELLEKRYILGMTSREIGEELGVPAATVRSRLHLATGKLRAQKAKLLVGR